MLKDHWKRICGLHCSDDGRISAVWLAHNPEDDVIHLYDSYKFPESTEFAVVVEGLNARGRNIPISWSHKEISENLLNKGCNMLVEAAENSPAMAEVVSGEILARLRSGRFKVEQRLSDWLAEFKTFNRDGSQVPTDSHPLMTATRYAVADLANARSNQKASNQKMFRKVAVV